MIAFMKSLHSELYTVQPAYKVVQIQGMSAYSVRSPGPDSCVYIGIGMGESRLYEFCGYRGGPEPFHISGLHCTVNIAVQFDTISMNKIWLYTAKFTPSDVLETMVYSL